LSGRACPPPGAAVRLRRALAAGDPLGSPDVSATRSRSWADVLTEHAPREATGARLVAQLRACEASALAFCRLLERWARGDADPCTPGRRQAALRRAADRAETALAGLERPLSRYLLELEPEVAEGRSWYGGPGAAELREWDAVLARAGVKASRTPPASALRPTGARCGPGCSTCAKTSSARLCTTCARWPRSGVKRARRRL